MTWLYHIVSYCIHGIKFHLDLSCISCIYGVPQISISHRIWERCDFSICSSKWFFISPDLTRQPAARPWYPNGLQDSAYLRLISGPGRLVNGKNTQQLLYQLCVTVYVCIRVSYMLHTCYLYMLYIYIYYFSSCFFELIRKSPWISLAVASVVPDARRVGVCFVASKRLSGLLRKKPWIETQWCSNLDQWCG